MSIRKFLLFFLTLFVLLFVYFFIKHNNWLKIVTNKSKIEKNDFDIIKYDCSEIIQSTSNLYIKYLSNEYKVLINREDCNNLKKNKLKPSLYYDYKNDKIIHEDSQIFFALMVLSLIISFIPLFGFYVYRNELDNSYKTM